MRPMLDISAKNSFTVWESGRWNEDKGYGSSILVAGPDSEPLPVIFEREPTQNVPHCLFYANVGCILAGSYVKHVPDQNRWLFTLEMVKIESLYTQQVQGHPVPRITDTVLYTKRVLVLDPNDTFELLKGFEQPQSLPHSRELMELAIQKSLLPAAEQRMFYGVARIREEE